MPASSTRASRQLSGGTRGLQIMVAIEKLRHELARELRAVGFVEIEHVGGYAIPPPFWTVLPRALLTPLDRAFASLEPLTVSYLHLASRRRQ